MNFCLFFKPQSLLQWLQETRAHGFPSFSELSLLLMFCEVLVILSLHSASVREGPAGEAASPSRRVGTDGGMLTSLLFRGSGWLHLIATGL